MKTIVINDVKYEIVKNYRDGFDLEKVKSMITEYFDNYDYIAGDWAYGKLRLKGFYEDDSKFANKINSINIFDNYIKEFCANNCRYFLLKKISNFD